MKKNGSKIAVFILSFIIGIGFVWTLGLFMNKLKVRPEIEIQPDFRIETVVIKRQGKGLEVKFKELVDGENGLAADFEVTNFEDESYFYSSYGQAKSNEPLSTIYTVKIGGNVKNLGWCGTGLEAYELKPGETRIFRVWNVYSHWENGKSIQIGFSFGKESDKEYQTFWSENLPIDEAAAKRFLKEKLK